MSIQQSINQAIGTIGAVAGIGKVVEGQQKQVESSAEALKLQKEQERTKAQEELSNFLVLYIGNILLIVFSSHSRFTFYTCFLSFIISFIKNTITIHIYFRYVFIDFTPNTNTPNRVNNITEVLSN